MRLLGDREAIARFVAQAFGDAGTPPDLVGAAARFTRLAEIAYEAPQDQSAALLRSLAESLREIEAPQCRDLLTDELLANARTNEAVAASLRNLDVGELCEMLVADSGGVARGTGRSRSRPTRARADLGRRPRRDRRLGEHRDARRWRLR